MRRSLTGFGALYLLARLTAIGWAAGPFGFEPQTHPGEYGTCELREDGDGTWYECTAAPIPHPAFESYFVRYVDGVGVCLIQGIGERIKNDATGYKTRAAVDKLHKQVGKKYGPSKTLDAIFPDSLWRAHRHWMRGVLTGDRMYIHYWNAEGGFQPVGLVKSIHISVEATSANMGYPKLEFVLIAATTCEEKMNQAASEAF